MENRKSIWKMASPIQTCYSQLQHNIDVDVAIIGAGITGITSAIQLVSAGKNVVIIDSKKIAEGTTGYSTANLYLPVQPSCKILQLKFGNQVVKNIIESRNTAINYIEETVKKNNIDCNFIKRPLYFFTSDKKKNILIEKEKEAQLEAGVEVKIADNIPLPFPTTKAAVIENQARFNPYQYAHSLIKKLHSDGCQIYENTPITKIDEHENYVQLFSDSYEIKAKKVIIATHIPVGIHKTHFLSYPYRSYAVAVKLKSNYPNGIFWDINFPFQSISTHNVHGKEIDLMIVAGNSHKTGHSKERTHQQHYEKTEKYIRERFDVTSVEHKWSAQHYQTADGIPYIGLSSNQSKHLYIGTGYHTDGLVYGTVAGLILSDLILENNNKWAPIFNPNRFTPIKSGLRFVKENISVSLSYLKGYADNIQAKQTDEIKKGEGKILKIEGKKCAAYRDDANKLHIVSAICPHMAGVVKWNDAEKSWDCPCHGSRFHTDGSVLEGPSLMPLTKINLES